MQRACLQLVELFVGPLSTMASQQFEVALAKDANARTNTLIGCALETPVELWSYVVLAISAAGLAYIALNAAR